MTDFLYTDARWTEHFVEVSDPHKEGHHVRFYFEPPQRTWVGLMRGVRVEGDTVIISVHYGNDAARQVCGALLEEKNNG
jgi:hypothetical protein